MSTVINRPPGELSAETIKQLKRVTAENPFPFDAIKAAYDIIPDIELIKKACRFASAMERFGWEPADVLTLLLEPFNDTTDARRGKVMESLGPGEMGVLATRRNLDLAEARIKALLRQIRELREMVYTIEIKDKSGRLLFKAEASSWFAQDVLVEAAHNQVRGTITYTPGSST